MPKETNPGSPNKRRATCQWSKGNTLGIARPKIDATRVYATREADKSHTVLQTQMQLGDAKMREICETLRYIIKETLDIYSTFNDQKDEDYEAYLNKCSTVPDLQRYEDQWPAIVYCKLYLVNAQPSTKVHGKNSAPKSPESGEVSVPTPSRKKKLDASAIDSGSRRDRMPCLAEFLQSLEPPQPKLLAVLRDAGIVNDASFRILLVDELVKDGVLNQLLREKSISQFQYILLKIGMRRGLGL